MPLKQQAVFAAFLRPPAASLKFIWQIALPAAKYTPVGPPVPMATKAFWRKRVCWLGIELN